MGFDKGYLAADDRIEEALRSGTDELDLSRLELTRVPESLSRLTQLRILDLSNNDLTTLPEFFGQLTGLYTLDLSGNQLAALPESFGELTGLNTLNLAGNELTTLPESFGRLKQLRWLRLMANFFPYPPSCLWQLSELTYLDLEATGLRQLPEAISSLRKLEEIDLDANNMLELPVALGELPKLTELDVFDNPLPAELLRLAEEEILIPYLRELAAEGGTQKADTNQTHLFNEAKLLLVGPGEVGKSWLLQALQGKIPQRGETTKGLEIAREPLVLEHPLAPGRLLHINCWDFGGQENYQITHQVFFSPKGIYLLVWKPRPGTDPDLVARLERIELSAGRTAKVFIVSTHADGNVPAVIGQDALRERFGDLIWGFYMIDSAAGPDGTGIAALKSEIAKAAAQLEGMDTPFPATWHTAHNAVCKLRKPTITFAEFEKIATDHGVSANGVEGLVIILDEQGHAVYFADAITGGAGVMREDNLVVLDPEWLAKAVTFVLEDQETRENSGVLEHRRLAEIWKKDPHRNCPGYRKALHGFLLWLMWKFDIAYKQSEHSSLVPELIQRNRPDDLYWTPSVPPQDPQAILIGRIPKNPPVGLVPVLTAAVHPLRKIHSHSTADRLDRNWRDGFFLDTTHRGSAFVELDDRDLRIVVRDRYPSNLVSLVRKTLDRIVEARWPQLQIDYRVPCIARVGGRPCPGSFKWQFLEKRRSQKVPCEACENDVDVEKMLQGVDAREEKMMEELRNLKDGQTDLMTVALRIYRDALDPSRNELERAPNMFTIIPNEPGGWNVLSKLTENQLRVTCWCEHPDGPHPGAAIGSGNPPDYVLKVAKEWLVKATPYISWAALLLKAFVPMVGTGVKQVLGNNLAGDLKNQIDLMSEASKAIPTGKLEVGEKVELNAIHRSRPEIAALRHIHDALLVQVSEDKRWGDLRPVRTKSGDLLWLCEQHAAVQQPPPIRPV